jgi:hypothetical protein
LADLFDALRDSPSYRSFRSEMRVESVLEKLGWRTQHSPEYTDPREEKAREMDVAAARSWKRERKNTTQIAHLGLVIECKSIRDDQLLLARATQTNVDRLYHHWLGLDDDELRDAIGTITASAGFDAAKVLRRFEPIAYPSGRAAIMPLLVNAPPARVRASAVREARRESESSLIRKATLQLFASLHGTIAEERDAALRQLQDDLRKREEFDRLDYALECLRSAVSTVLLFHPIVVVDAKLVALDREGEMEIVDWARLDRGRMFSYDRQWFDVVSADHFESYAAELTAWYSRVFDRIAKRV